MDQSNSRESSGGRPLAVDTTDHSKSSGPSLFAANQVDQSISHESSGGRPLASETGHSKSSGLPLLTVDQVHQSNSDKFSGGRPLAVDTTDHSKSSGPSLFAGDQMGHSKWSSGRPLPMGHYNVNKSIDQCSFLETSHSVTPTAADHSINPLCIGGRPLNLEDRTVDIQSYSFRGGHPFTTSLGVAAAGIEQTSSFGGHPLQPVQRLRPLHPAPLLLSSSPAKRLQANEEGECVLY